MERCGFGLLLAGLTIGTVLSPLPAQDSLQPLAIHLFPLRSARGWTMEQTIYLDGQLQSGKRDIVFRVMRSRRIGADRFEAEVETRVGGLLTEREIYREAGTAPPILLTSIKTPDPKAEIVFNPPIVVLKNALKSGQIWTWNGTEQIGGRKRKAIRRFRVYGFEAVKTPAGEFQALSVEETCPGVITRTWYAPNIGRVKRTIRGASTKTVLLLSAQA